MLDDAILKAQDAIEAGLKTAGHPVKAGELLKSIRGEGVRDIDLREAVWLLIGMGKISLTPNRELVLEETTESEPLVK